MLGASASLEPDAVPDCLKGSPRGLEEEGDLEAELGSFSNSGALLGLAVSNLFLWLPRGLLVHQLSSLSTWMVAREAGVQSPGSLFSPFRQKASQKLAFERCLQIVVQSEGGRERENAESPFQLSASQPAHAVRMLLAEV